MGLNVTTSGSFSNMDKFFRRMTRRNIFATLERYGIAGVDALSNATPKDTGETSLLWKYKIVEKKGEYTIEWYNDNVVDGVQIAIVIQYGHATGTGGFVQGRDYINPAMRPIFDKMAEEVWKVVTQR